MFTRVIYILLIATLVVASHDPAAKKPKRSRRPKNEEESTPQPSVISYSTFGFNDVGSYDGFVPTSPDYASYLNNGNRESHKGLYAPAFPSAPDTTGFGSDLGQIDGYPDSENGEPQSSMLQYPQNSMNFFNTHTLDNSDTQSKNIASNEAVKNAEELSGPIYGTKLSSKNKKPINSNNTEFHVYSSGPVFNSNELVGRFKQQEMQFAQDNKFNNGELVNSDHNGASYNSNYPAPETDDFAKAQTNNNALKFPRVVDFTNIKQYYPTELDDKYQVSTYSSIMNNQNENQFQNVNENQMNQFLSPTQPIKESIINTKPVYEEHEKENIKPNMNLNSDFSSHYNKPITSSKPGHKNSIYNSDFKDNYKNKLSSGNNDNDFKNLRNQLSPGNSDDDFKNVRNHLSSIHSDDDFKNLRNQLSSGHSENNFKNLRNPFKGYEYSTDYSNTSFKYEYIPDRKPYNTDEPIPASSNIDLTSYNSPDTDFSNFKKIPEINIPFDDDFDIQQSSRDKFKSEEFLSQFKNLYTPTPSTKWGNVFKSADFSYKHRFKRPQYEESTNNDMVHIPKRPQNNYKYNYGSNLDSKLHDFTKQRPYKSNRYERPKDWNKEVTYNRFKSEEDLLDLRNHDTSHPSYLPSQHRPSGNDLLDDSDYKKLVEKWRQSYWKSKYRDGHRDYDSYASEETPLHVPIPKPYPVQVPVVKPYPVHIPHVRPVFHHTRPHREEFDAESDDDDYFPRPESSKKTPPYKKRPKSTHGRPRRPTRMTYHDRGTSRRRWPTSQRSPDVRRRPSSKEYHAPYRHRDVDTEREYDSEHTDYYYCKRTGNC
ncbi:hypothetical protein evm_000853 [Chilo suppressalis]|nr:hypothetical protein evm_000853 [Chilo suppressalis]